MAKLSIDDADVFVGDVGTVLETQTIARLDAPTDHDVTFLVRDLDESKMSRTFAAPGVNYKPIDAVFTIPAGQTEVAIPFTAMATEETRSLVSILESSELVGAEHGLHPRGAVIINVKDLASRRPPA